MTSWLKLSDADRLATLKQASAGSGISIKAIEKDWWVTLVLKAIFQCKYADHLLFKGGTSLSKCWKLIDRFSEDIDLALDRSFFGEVEEWSHGQVKRLKRKACAFTRNELKAAIEEELMNLGVAEGLIIVTAGEVKETMRDKDPQEILISYPTATGVVDYVADLVKVEVSARSLREPWSICEIGSLLDEYLPGQEFNAVPFNVPTVEPKRTFLEKLFLLHEEFQRQPGEIRNFRMSRHPYDISRMMNTDHGKEALSDDNLYNTIISHRKTFAFLPWVDYEKHSKSHICFIPPVSAIEAYRKDYITMTETMIYGEAPSFDEMIAELKKLQETMNKGLD